MTYIFKIEQKSFQKENLCLTLNTHLSNLDLKSQSVKWTNCCILQASYLVWLYCRYKLRLFAFQVSFTCIQSVSNIWLLIKLLTHGPLDRFVSQFVDLNHYICCSEASNFSNLDKYTNCTNILSTGRCTCSLIHFYKEVCIMLLVL